MVLLATPYRNPARGCRGALLSGGQELWEADEVVGGGCEGECPSDPVGAPEPRLALPRHHLDPAERLLDPLSHLLTGAVVGVPGRAPVDARPSPAGVATWGVTFSARRSATKSPAS